MMLDECYLYVAKESHVIDWLGRGAVMFSEAVWAKINKHRLRPADILHCVAERSSIGDGAKEAH